MNNHIYSIEEIKTQISPIAKEFGIDRIYLFGSYARGQATSQSDLDFRIDPGRLKGLFALGHLYNTLSDQFDKPIDIVTGKSLDPEFLSEVSHEEVLLYDRH
jgi:predicted nucleotidyltransferase